MSWLTLLLLQVATSPLLKRLFRTVLATGNALNAGTSHGGADGFRLETLQKLSNVKARAADTTNTRKPTLSQHASRHRKEDVAIVTLQFAGRALAQYA